MQGQQSYLSAASKYSPTFPSTPLAAPSFGYDLFLFLS